MRVNLEFAIFGFSIGSAKGDEDYYLDHSLIPTSQTIHEGRPR